MKNKKNKWKYFNNKYNENYFSFHLSSSGYVEQVHFYFVSLLMVITKLKVPLSQYKNIFKNFILCKNNK